MIDIKAINEYFPKAATLVYHDPDMLLPLNHCIQRQLAVTKYQWHKEKLLYYVEIIYLKSTLGIQIFQASIIFIT